MKKYIILFVLFLGLFVSSVRTTAQESTLMHFMRHSPQSLHSNPANTLDSMRYYVGIPFLSNINFGINFPFSYSDWIRRDSQTDSLYLKQSIVNKLNNDSRIGMDFSYELLSFGFRFKEKNMLTFSLAAKAYGTVLFPKDIAVLVLEGNTPGETLSVKSDLNGAAYAELALGYARRINENWKAGVRVKYLMGLAGASGKDLKAEVHTSEQDYAMTLTSSALVQTSFIEGGELGNNGVAFDAGVYYKSPIKGLDVSLSMVDWGSIKWKTGLEANQSVVKNGKYVFEGLTDLDDSDFNSVVDTLKEVIDFKEVDDPKSFSTRLPGKIFLGASYNLTPMDKFGFLFSTRALHNFQRTTFSLMYNRQVGRWLSVSAGNNFMTDQAFNPSVAILLRAGGFQFHLLTENISAFNVKDMRSINFQFGMNIAVFDKVKKKEKRNELGIRSWEVKN